MRQTTDKSWRSPVAKPASGNGTIRRESTARTAMPRLRISSGEECAAEYTTGCSLKASHTCKRLVAWQKGGEMCRVSRARTLKHMRGNAFRAYAALFQVWKMTRTNESKVGQSESCPLASQGLSCLWLAPHGFAVRRLKSQKARPQLMRTTMHLQSMIFLCLNACHKLHTRGYRQTNLDVLYAARRQDAGLRALLRIVTLPLFSLCMVASSAHGFKLTVLDC